MRLPIRVVCEGCLRSVELASDSGPTDEFPCPHCGVPVDSRFSRIPSSEAETRVPESPGDSETTDAPESINWATAWSRGTLGSLGRFQLRERLGDGGFGQVYLAFDPRLDRDVAIKVLKLADPSERVMERFFREARAVARLDHPNIVSVYDAGHDAGRCWVAYQLVNGRPLSWYRDRQRMDPATAARIIRDLAEALGHAHAMGVVHRDIKPGNVIVDDRGRPRLIDFGLARRSNVDSNLTHDGVVVGTPAYMSPEQARGHSREADERSDVYSLGVIFYELLAGRRPGEARMEFGAAKAQSPDKPPPVPNARAINPAVPAVLDAICTKAMSPRPTDRYPTARALADAIDAWVGRRRIQRRPIALGLVCLALCATGILAAFLSRPGARDEARVAPAAPQVHSARKPVYPIVGTDKDLAAALPLKAGLLVTSRNSKKYHITPCRHADGIDAANRILLSSPQEARQKGRQPCETCKPPAAGSESAPTVEKGAEASQRVRPAN